MTPRALFAREAASIARAALPAVGSEQLKARWDSLPEPVQRYLRFAVAATPPAIRTAHLRHDGGFRPSPNMRFLPIRGEECFAVGEPGFTWTARVRGPLYWIDARDCYLAGKGNMLVKPFSLIPLIDAHGPELDQGAAHRWLAEAVWFPYGFAGDCVEWEAVDPDSARATLRCTGLPVSAVMEVDAAGCPRVWRAERYRDLGGGKLALTPWIVRGTGDREIGGFRVPTVAIVSWVIDGKESCYARFQVTALEYGFDGDRGPPPAK
jgi:hypothetical protein